MNHRDIQHWDNSGVPQTCKSIDKVITYLERLEDLDALGIIDEMELIRLNNEKLREHGAELNRDLTEEIDNLQEESGKKTDQIADLEDEIRTLKDEIRELNNLLNQ